VFQIVVIMFRGKEDRKNPSAPFILFGQSLFQVVTKQTPLETFASKPNGPDFFIQLCSMTKDSKIGLNLRQCFYFKFLVGQPN
jgi:hypothetical protein